MADANLYREFDTYQQIEAEDVFREFLNYPLKKSNGFETIIDIGTGPGDTLVLRILPQLRNKPSKVVGVDISKEMVEAAAGKYQNEILNFQLLDIQSDSYEPNGHLAHGTYDLVTSFYCYHWVRNERQALSNIYNLMKPGGSFVLLFLVRHCFYDICIEISKVDKYKKYIDLKKFVNPYYDEKDPVQELSRRLEKAGFKLEHVELRHKEFKFRSVEDIENYFKAVVSFKMPEEIANEFNRECALKIAEDCLKHQSEYESGFVARHKVLVSFVVK